MRFEDVREAASYGALGASVINVAAKVWRRERVTIIDIAALAASAVPVLVSALERDEEKGRRVEGW